MGGRPPGRVRRLALLVGYGLRAARREPRPIVRAAADSLFQATTWLRWQFAGLGDARTPYFPSREALLEEATRQAPPDGLWMEFGVFRGESLRLLASRTPRAVFGFDSFEGLPVRWTPRNARGTFSTGGQLPEVPANAVLVKGLFADSLPPFLAEHRPIAVGLLHVDADLYESARFVLEQLAPGLGPGTVIVFDEFVTLVPDDEYRAFRHYLARSGRNSRAIGCSPSGSVAVVLGEAR